MKAILNPYREIEGLSPDQLLDLLEPVFPLIGQLSDTPQDPDWHGEGDVRSHTEMVIAEAKLVLENEGSDLAESMRLPFLLGAALHDIGKVLTTREEERDGRMRIVSPRHTLRGMSYVGPSLPTLQLEPWENRIIMEIIGRHHAPKSLVTRNERPSGFWRLSRSLDPKLVYLFELADLRGRTVSKENDEESLEILELFRQGAEESGAWGVADIYEGWRAAIAAELSGEGDQAIRYVTNRAIHEFETGRIFTVDEAIARTWEHRREFPSVTLVCGASGSGKSSWVQSQGDIFRVNLDQLREEITGKSDDQSRNGEVLQLAKERLREGLRAKRTIVWDATSLRANGRAMVVDLAHDYHAATRIVTLACPPDLLKMRNQQRPRQEQLPWQVVERQLDRLEWPEVWEAHEVEVLW